VVLVVGLPIGLLAGMSLNRSLSLGFYLVGAFLMVAGFFVGNRGPFRAKSDDPGEELPSPRGGRALRSASTGEQFEAMAVSGVFILLGLTLIALGAGVDSRFTVV
jgi:hypothetical protein